jgi:hypothetical protein
MLHTFSIKSSQTCGTHTTGDSYLEMEGGRSNHKLILQLVQARNKVGRRDTETQTLRVPLEQAAAAPKITHRQRIVILDELGRHHFPEN